MKKVLALVVMLVMLFSTTALAWCDCSCSCWNCSCNNEVEEWLPTTTLVVAGQGWKYNVRMNVRSDADIDSRDIGTVYGGDTFNIIGDFISTEDGRIWCPIWWNDELAYVSMRFLQPLEDEGSYFYLEDATNILKKADSDSEAFARFIEDQIILVEEIVINADGYWAKVQANDKYGYIPMLALKPIL